MRTSQRTSGPSVRAVIQQIVLDVPQINYGAKIEEVAKKIAFQSLPEEVRSIILKREAEPFIHFECWHPRKVHSGSIYLPLPRSSSAARSATIRLIEDAISPLIDAHAEQDVKLSKIRNELSATFRQFTTWAAARKALPGLAKYMPQPNQKTTYPVAVSGSVENAMAALVKAGWPKEKVAA